MGLETTHSLAILDALAPQQGWETDVALFSSYSVDLVAVAAIIEALAGEGGDHERMRKASLARACERMRDRFRVVCQAGRVAVPSSGASTLVIADRWIREVRHDGNQRSWHAKLALVRYRSMDVSNSETEWRLWIGSRNLTRDTSWDSALIALGKYSELTNSIDKSIARAGAVLADKAALAEWSPSKVEDELERLHWSWPEDIQDIVSFAMWPDAQPATGFPEPPSGLSHLVAVSPFVNGTIAKKLSKWGKAVNRQLLTTHSTLSDLATQKAKPLTGFSSLHQLEIPASAEDADQDETGDDQMVEVHRGLHAKLLWTRSRPGDELWLGSANLTERAWDGSNTEVVVHVRVVPLVGNGLIGGLVNGLATEVTHNTLTTDKPAKDPAEQSLDYLHNRIAACLDARLERDEDTGILRCNTNVAPLRVTDNAELSIRLLGQTGWVSWPPKLTSVELPATSLHCQSELLELELRLIECPDLAVSWIARAVMNPPINVTRDRAVLARLMGPRAFLVWLRTLLGEITGEVEDDTWPERKNDQVRQPLRLSRNGPTMARSSPTLEYVLRAWMRNPTTVLQVDQALDTWASEIRAGVTEDADPVDRKAIQELDRFETTWKVIREGLHLGGTRS